MTTPTFEPSRLVLRAAEARQVDLGQRPLALARVVTGDEITWVTSVLVARHRGDRAAAAADARRLASAATPGPADCRDSDGDGDLEGLTILAGDGGLVTVRLTSPALTRAALAVSPTWATDLVATGALSGPGRPILTGRRRFLADPAYAAVLAHARLCRAAGSRGSGGAGPSYGLSDALLGLVADASRVVDRVREDGRGHHLVDWIAATGSAVVTWSDDSRRDRREGPRGRGPSEAAALRATLADALRAVGLTPTERF